MKVYPSILMHFDKIWCGKTQVPAFLLSTLSCYQTTLSTLASFRFLLALFSLTELLGYFFITLGLSAYRPSWIFLIGVLLKSGGAILGAFFQNKSGIFLSLALQKYLKKLRTHSVEILSFLTDKGCSESEINALSSLPTEVYQAELNGYQRTRILNIGAPLFCGLALLSNGDIITALIVIILGLASFPIGEKFFKEHSFRRESELRLGLAAQLLKYVDKIYKEHLWLTTKVNFLSQLPLLLFTCRFIWNGSGQLLSSFFGLTQGLIGLTGTLAFQKARVSTMRTTETTTHLINALSSPDLIVTPQRWQEHCALNEKNNTSFITKKSEGIVLEHFSSKLSFQEQESLAISCFIPFGSIALLQAPSGRGKSTFISAVIHLIEHRGELFFLFNDKKLNAHSLSREEFDSKIFFFREANIDTSTRLIDLFKNITYVDNQPFLQNAQVHFDSILIELAWKIPDNLLEQEIKNIEAHRHSVFPNQMLDFLKDLRKKQATQIGSFLAKAGGNLISNRISPERNFVTLSSGEKQRLLTLIGLESCRAIKTICFVILDEPLTHLDKQNIEHQLQTIEAMQKLPNPPSILLISHHFINELKEKLHNVQEIK